MGQTKTCIDCKVDKDFGNFAKVSFSFIESYKRRMKVIFSYDGDGAEYGHNRKPYCNDCTKRYEGRGERRCILCDLNKKKKEFYKNNKSTCKKCTSVRVRQLLGDNLERSIWMRSKARAEKKGMGFDLDIKDIVIPTHCPVLGMQLELNNTHYTKDSSPSIDRIDNTGGYTKGNIRIISFKANRIKSNHTIEALRAVVKYMEDPHRRQVCNFGSNNVRSKLTEQDVIEIRKQYKPRVVGIPTLARAYNVGRTTIRNVIHRNTWKHVK